jgi:hypothetical protein
MCVRYIKDKVLAVFMGLIGIIGNSDSSINRKMLMLAARNAPSLIVDCANCANPHAMFNIADIDKLNEIYVIELELLYKFRDVLLRVPSIMRRIEGRMIVVTTSDHLFNYQDETENKNVLEHAWYLLRKIGERYSVFVGLNYSSKQLRLAKRYCNRLLGEKNGTYCVKPAHDG